MVRAMFLAYGMELCSIKLHEQRYDDYDHSELVAEVSVISSNEAEYRTKHMYAHYVVLRGSQLAPLGSTYSSAFM
jgi:hypothetical protein